jgi:hypothetical protein
MTSPIKVKFLARTSADQDPTLWLSLFKGRIPQIGEVKFTFDLDARDYDWLVVYEDLTALPNDRRSNRAEPLACARENTLFITTEPTSIKLYGPGYFAQYGHVLTKQPRDVVRHKNHIFETPPLRWYYGRPLDPDDNNYLDIDHYNATKPLTKTQNLSTVCSNKQMAVTLHQQRYNFVMGLKDILGDDFDVFGRGIRPITDKAEAMDSFRYHIAIENHVEAGHFTEKITDCFLAYCVPFYFGPPDIMDYFPEGSIIPIDIFDIEGAAEIIRAEIKPGSYEARLPTIIKARQQTLTDYNLMQKIAKIVSERHDAAALPKLNQFIYGRHIYRKKKLIAALGDIYHRYRVNRRL